MGKLIDLTGQRFGRLVVLSRHRDNDKQGATRWSCRCDCGASTIVRRSDLRDGNTRSCGCYARELSRTHGMSKSLEYQIWRSMINRCTNSNDKGYRRYGGRGIEVCARWHNSFESFYEDMGKKPGPEYSIDRIDNDGNYEPGNCQWIPLSANSAKQSSNVFVTRNSLTLCIADWARELGVKGSEINYWLYQRNFTPDQAVAHVALKQDLLREARNSVRACEVAK